jgi:signal transduction histidine kinase
MKKQLEHLNSLAELGLLSTSLLHDLSNLLSDEVVDSVPEVRNLFSIYKEVINQESSKKARINVKKQLISVIRLLNHKAKEKRITLKLDVPNKVEIKGSRSKFIMIFLNLVSNAIDASPKVSIVEVVAIEDPNDSKHVLISVIDQGEGISKHIQKKIFDAFYTTKGNKGTGLGLFFVKEIITKDFKAKISVQSKKGNGSTFKVIFPLL